MNTTDAILKNQKETGECETQQINTVLLAVACQSLREFIYGIVVSTEIKKVKLFTRTYKTGKVTEREIVEINWD